MPTIWRATYADARGLEAVKILGDGGAFSVTIRGVTFAGPDLDCLRPLAELPAGRPFTLDQGALCACTLSWRMSLQISDGRRTQPAMIRGELTLGDPAPGGRPDPSVGLQLFYPGTELATTRPHETFESAVAELRERLAPGVALDGLPGPRVA
ncbi:MAG TPA: DUF6304 family protein [Streptosporangiaceae bacterium]|nr:DUF6304 family protein [Streptosporangiaceae bacterium]